MSDVRTDVERGETAEAVVGEAPEPAPATLEPMAAGAGAPPAADAPESGTDAAPGPAETTVRDGGADQAADVAPQDERGDDPEAGPSPLDGPRAAVIAACERLVQAARTTDIDFIRGQLGDLRARVAAVRPAELTPRRGLAGLFDSPRRRLARFREHVIDLAPSVATATVKLRDAAAAIERRNAALNTEREALRGALAELDAAGAERPDPAARTGVRHLALVRMIQNVDARLAQATDQLSAAAQSWRGQVLESLGVDGQKLRPLKRVRVDQGLLNEGCEALLAAVDGAESALAPARARRDDVMARMNGALDAARSEGPGAAPQGEA